MNYEKQRLGQLLRCIPDVFDYRTVLYVGAKFGRAMFLGDLIRKGKVVDIVEIYTPNATELKMYYPEVRVFNEDIRWFEAEVNYDTVIWFHGPEHVTMEDAEKTLEKLYNIINKILIVGCPYGRYEQGAIDGNENERHLTHYVPAFFKSLKFQTDVMGAIDVHGSNLLAWKRKE